MGSSCLVQCISGHRAVSSCFAIVFRHRVLPCVSIVFRHRVLPSCVPCVVIVCRHRVLPSCFAIVCAVCCHRVFIVCCHRISPSSLTMAPCFVLFSSVLILVGPYSQSVFNISADIENTLRIKSKHLRIKSENTIQSKIRKYRPIKNPK